MLRCGSEGCQLPTWHRGGLIVSGFNCNTTFKRVRHHDHPHLMAQTYNSAQWLRNFKLRRSGRRRTYSRKTTTVCPSR